MIWGFIGVAHSCKAEDPQSFGIIVDAETEETLRLFLDPMLEIAGIPPYKVRLVIVNTPVVNASAVPGGIIAVNTGLLLKVKNLGELLAVLAHEVGHFKGGHHTRIQQAAQKSTATMIMGMLMGGIAMAAGQADAGMALVMGGQHVAMQTYLAHRRSEESAADQAAVDILDRMQISTKGMSSFFETLTFQTIRIISQAEAYSLTHPLNAERVRFVQHHLSTSNFKDSDPPADWVEKWERVQQKLLAFLTPSNSIKPKLVTASEVARLYGNAVTCYRQFKLNEAINISRILIEKEPNNPFFNEFLAQILFETKKIQESLPLYRKAVSLRPESSILATQAAHAFIEAGKAETLDAAVALLKKVVQKDSDMVMAWHFLGVAYGKKGDMGRAAACLAEKAIRIGDTSMAKVQAMKASKLLQPGVEEYLKAQDILQTLNDKKHHNT
ncbi:MAG: M48 family metalloprotease [Alphaproteobacteria bacterium]|nr:M48 family metalloprotease [Alphaproteobacteria bacterium]